jgi:hypothetical protein
MPALPHAAERAAAGLSTCRRCQARTPVASRAPARSAACASGRLSARVVEYVDHSLMSCRAAQARDQTTRTRTCAATTRRTRSRSTTMRASRVRTLPYACARRALERGARLLPRSPGAMAARVRRGGAAGAPAASGMHGLSTSSAAGALLRGMHRKQPCAQPATGLPAAHAADRAARLKERCSSGLRAHRRSARARRQASSRRWQARTTRTQSAWRAATSCTPSARPATTSDAPALRGGAHGVARARSPVSAGAHTLGRRGRPLRRGRTSGLRAAGLRSGLGSAAGRWRRATGPRLVRSVIDSGIDAGSARPHTNARM